MSLTVSTILSLLAVIIAHHQIDAQVKSRGKTRSLLVAVKEVADINQKLANASQDGAPQWQASFKNDFALLPDENFVFGVLEKPGTVRALPKRPPTNRRPPLKPGQTKPETGKIRIPKEYNARAVYAQKCPSLNHVMYQGSCGNCWAVACTAMINDRSCMYQKPDEEQKFFSAKHLTTCLPKGCDGGWYADALQFWITDGMVTGGDFRMNQPAGCKATPTDTGTMKNATCKPTCDDGSEIFEEEKSFGGARYEIKSKNVNEIMAEIYLYGPVIATFDVYDDFAHYYKKGVYKRISDKKLGGHAAKLYGWGVENNVPFWYAANSWGKDWGDGGFFKIQRGTNECNIETNIHAAIPSSALF
jgi:hypothetical protein